MAASVSAKKARFVKRFVVLREHCSATLTPSLLLSKILRPMRLRPSPEHLRFSAMVAIFIASGLGITYLLLPPAPEDADKPRPPPALRVAGSIIPPGGDPVANALDLVRRYAT